MSQKAIQLGIGVLLIMSAVLAGTSPAAAHDMAPDSEHMSDATGVPTQVSALGLGIQSDHCDSFWDSPLWWWDCNGGILI